MSLPPSSDGKTTVAPVTPLTAEDIVDRFAADDKDDKVADSPDDKEKIQDPLEDKEEDEEDKEDEEESEEEDPDEEDKIELVDEDKDDEEEEKPEELIVPVKKKDIEKEFPGFFKKFPQVERLYFKGQQYTEVFPTVDDAKEAANKAGILDKFEVELTNGRLDNVLAGVANIRNDDGEPDPEAFNKLVDDYLPALARVNQGAFNVVVGNVLRTAIQGMIEFAAEDEENKDYAIAAKLLSKFAFKKADAGEPIRLSKAPTDKGPEDKLRAREEEISKREFDRVRDDLDSRVKNVIKATIAANIDPKNIMPEYLKKSASEDVLKRVEALMMKDPTFKSHIQKLWVAAYKGGYSRASLEAIRKSFLGKAKSHLRPVIDSVRSDAIKGLRRGENKEGDRPRRSQLPNRSSTSSQKEKMDKKPAGMSTLEFINSQLE